MRAASLATERRHVLEALAGDRLNSSAIARSIHSSAGETDQSLLFPALHSLEADGRLTAEWQLGTDGRQHRTYRKRRLVPFGIAR
jgi:DNA-binding PadR family transcriptional regulator